MYEEASQPVVELIPIETDEKREGAFLLSAISCGLWTELGGQGMHHYFHPAQRTMLLCPETAPMLLLLCGPQKHTKLNVSLNRILPSKKKGEKGTSFCCDPDRYMRLNRGT